jgi:hypothetical protein
MDSGDLLDPFCLVFMDVPLLGKVTQRHGAAKWK